MPPLIRVKKLLKAYRTVFDSINDNTPLAVSLFSCRRTEREP